MVEQLAHARRAGHGHVEQGAQVGQRLVNALQHQFETLAVHAQLVVDLLQGMAAYRIGVVGQPDIGNAAGQRHAALEQVGRLARRFAGNDGFGQVARQLPLLAQVRTDVGMAAIEQGAFAHEQVVVVGGAFKQGRVGFRACLQQGKNADVLQQAGQHQLLDPAHAAAHAQKA